MDPSSPDFFRRLKLTLQLSLIAICSGLGVGLYCTGLLAFSKIISKFMILPEVLEEFLRHLAALWFFVKQIQNAMTFLNFRLPPQMAEEFEAEYERPIPILARCILPGLRILTFLASGWYFLGRSDVFLAPLRAFSTEPSWILLVPYSYHVLKITLYVPDVSIGFFSPSITALVVDLLVYPYEAWIRRRRRLLLHTFVEGPVRGNKNLSSLAQFQYSPITKPGVFRLLKLMTIGGRMSATLEHFSVDACPPYWAISYMWGSNKMDHQLVFHANGGSRLPITESCATVLTLLTPLQTRYLWIDAICINQHSPDGAEKVLQIPLMADIYSRADQVVGCMSTNAIPADKNPLRPSFLFDLTRFIRFNPRVKAMRLPYLHHISDWIGFCWLLDHGYWQRAWIVQEMALAKKLIFVYGEASFSLEQYSYVVKNLSNRMAIGKVTNENAILKYVPSLFILLTRMSDRLDMLRELKKSIDSADRSQWPSLAQVADMQYTIMSTDPRDQIFALLGLASDGAAPELKPDYNHSNTYEKAIKSAIFHSFDLGQLHLFLGAGLAYRNEDGDGQDLPSWVPVFPKPKRRREGNWALEKVRKGTFHLQYLVSADKRELSVQGAIADEIAILCPVSVAVPWVKLQKDQENTGSDRGGSGAPPAMVGPRDDLIQWGVKNLSDFFRATRRLADLKVPPKYASKTSRSEAYQRAMVMDWDGAGRGGTSPASNRTLTTFMKFRAAYEDAFKGGSVKPNKEVYDHDFQATFKQLFFSHWYNYDFAITRQGLIAWVPQGSLPGDILCFFNGVDVPFSLRPAGLKGSGQHYLVGDAYIHGLMRGEAKELNTEAIWFKII
ncbi:hypothetical protein G7Y89_g5868 [Cudoniella acicularis]|uniref:Heterokaryon incompatibility domain-containing protein n=1 Tax=Cudoniella acicularis TaxID=354080 RepID=A0A8H4RNZ3_9HELO|nr:hypothetical protein G7Y89_g5868 [Cudoniella acicularis]